MQVSFKSRQVDALADVLNTVRLHSRIHYYTEMSASWSLELPVSQFAYFHVVARGGGWLKLKQQKKPLPLASGDLVIVPHGGGHVICDNLKTPPLTLEQFLRSGERGEFRHAGDDSTTLLICGVFQFDNADNTPLLKHLPSVIRVPGNLGQADEWLAGTLNHLASEARHPRPGAETMISRLTDIIFVHAIRYWIEEQRPGGWLGALRDRQIGAALGLMHREPQRRWSVATLAGEVAMSRSQFAERFRTLVGETPLNYLTKWRMYSAATLMTRDNLNVSEVAARVGYDSETAFSKAFKRHYDVAPGAYKRAWLLSQAMQNKVPHSAAFALDAAA